MSNYIIEEKSNLII